MSQMFTQLLDSLATVRGPDGKPKRSQWFRWDHVEPFNRAVKHGTDADLTRI